MEIQNQNETQLSNNEVAGLSPHEQAMLDKVDANDEKTQQEMKPDSEIEPSQTEESLLAGKYKSAEELEKAYKELEAKLGSKPDEEAAEENKEEPKSETEAKEAAENAGVDYASIEAEYQENGTLSEATYKDLADKGIPKEMVDQYIAGQEAVVQQAQVKLQALAGGEQGYNEMIQWAAENLSEGEKDAFNSSLNNTNQAEFAIQGLYSRFKAAQGPNLVKGQSNVGTTAGYQSKAEMTQDMHDPRYKKDPAFRAMVQRKLAKSNW